MTTVLLIMSALIRFAYTQCQKTTAILRLHTAVEALRHREEDTFLQMDSGSCRFRVEKEDKKVVGHVSGADWNMTIESRIFEPEEFLRLLTMLPEQQEGEVK